MGLFDTATVVLSPAVQMATSDGIAYATVPLYASGLNNGSTEDRWRDSSFGDGAVTGIAAVHSRWYNGSNFDKARTPNTFKTATATASGNTALWTPTSGKKFRLMRFFLQVTSNAVASSAGVLEVTFQDSASAMPFGFSAFIPGAAGTVIGAEISTPWVDLGNGFLSAAANNVLNVNLSFALTGGEVRAIGIGTEE